MDNLYGYDKVLQTSEKVFQLSKHYKRCSISFEDMDIQLYNWKVELIHQVN